MKVDKRTKIPAGEGTRKGTYIETNASGDPTYNKRVSAGKPAADPSFKGGNQKGYASSVASGMKNYNNVKSAGQPAADPSTKDAKAGPRTKVGTATQSTNAPGNARVTPYGHMAFSTRGAKDPWDK